MKKTVLNLKVSALALALGAALSPAVQAQTAAEELQQLRATTQALINTLVESGLLTREKAAAMLRQTQAGAASPAAPETGADGKRVVRVPYVPEAVRREMREQIKGEVLSQAKSERWGQPDAYPEWMGRFSFEGDLRARVEGVSLAGDNTAPGLAGFKSGDYTRAADLALNNVGGLPNGNTQEDFDRTRVRARLGVGAKVSDQVAAGVRLSTGSSTGSPTSTNQTMGQSFNKYAVVLDRVFVQVKPDANWGVTAGRMANPFYSTDLVYADDLGFEGFALSGQRKWQGGESFASVGYFPLTENRPGATRARSLVGLQLGNAYKLANQDDLKVGLALYSYQGMTASRETEEARSTRSDYAVRYEYGSALRQRGNTLFRVNSQLDSGTTMGLASEFKILNLTTSVGLRHLLGQPVVLTADVVKNLGFDAKKMEARTGQPLDSGKDYGYMLRGAYGPAQVLQKGQWNASLAYRYLGSDAVLDAFTNSDFGLGGTNNKGWILQGSYGLYKNTWLSARWLSANQIDSFAPGKSTKLSSDILQLDLNARF
jgi:hypothetical protein